MRPYGYSTSVPELPDVEGFRRVAEQAAGHEVRSVHVHDAGVLRNVSACRFAAAMHGARLGSARRHGKVLLIPTGAGDEAFPAMLVHFGMTGMLLWCTVDEPAHAHDRVVLCTDGGALRYRDQRKLTGIRLLDDKKQWEAQLSELGPDAADIGLARLREQVGRTRRQLKAALMDQARVAGLGNLTVDEILWRARLHPRTPTTELSDQAWRRLHQRLRGVTEAAARAGCVPARRTWLTGSRDERDGSCPRCATALTSAAVSGRTTVWCPHCQRI